MSPRKRPEDWEEGSWSRAERSGGNRGWGARWEGDREGDRARVRVRRGGTGGLEQRGFFQDFQRRSGIECISPHNSLCGAVAG